MAHDLVTLVQASPIVAGITVIVIGWIITTFIKALA